MNPDHPWLSLPILPQGDADGDRIYRAVGIALTCWELLEDSCASLYRLLLGAETHGAARAYGTIVAFKGRQEMVMAALREHPLYGSPPLEGLESLLNETGRFSGRRNEIAHGQLMNPIINGADRGHYLCAAGYNSNKRPAPRDAWKKDDTGNALVFGSYAYTGEQIETYAAHFTRLTVAANTYLWPLQSYWLEHRAATINAAVKRALEDEAS